MIIQLSREALERMLGGDSELEVHIRQQIADDFAKKHLKPLANDLAWKRVYAEIEKTVDGDVNAAVKRAMVSGEALAGDPDKSLYWGLTSKIEKAFDAIIEKVIAAKLKKFVEWRMQGFEHEVKRAIELAEKREIDKQVKAELERRIEAAIAMK